MREVNPVMPRWLNCLLTLPWRKKTAGHCPHTHSNICTGRNKNTTYRHSRREVYIKGADVRIRPIFPVNKHLDTLEPAVCGQSPRGQLSASPSVWCFLQGFSSALFHPNNLRIEKLCEWASSKVATCFQMNLGGPLSDNEISRLSTAAASDGQHWFQQQTSRLTA